jgi:hypothetical protein
MGCSAGYALFDPCQHSLGWICTPEFHSALLHRHQHSPCPRSTPHQALLASVWCTAFPTEFIILRFKLHFDSLRANLNSSLLDITIRANRHWNSISPIGLTRIIWIYKESLQLLRAVDELWVSAFVGLDNMGDSVDAIETMFD